MVKNPETGQWEKAGGQYTQFKRPVKGNNKFLTAEEQYNITQARNKISIPINTKAQDLDLTNWFTIDKRMKTATFSKEGYTFTKNDDGTYTIASVPKSYTTLYDRRDGKDTKKEKSTYVAHEITFDKDGNVSQSRSRFLYNHPISF